jgi:hypothetical protein
MQWILTQTQSIHDHQTSDNTESGFTHTRPMFSFIKKEFLANHDSNVCLSGSTGKDLNSWNPVRSSFENSIFYARICYVKQSGMIYGSDLFLKKKKKKKKKSLAASIKWAQMLVFALTETIHEAELIPEPHVRRAHSNSGRCAGPAL